MKPKWNVKRMKRNQITKIVVAIGLLLLLVASAAGSVRATPAYSGGDTDECGNSGCHDTLGTLTLASNSTSLSATTGEPFVLRIDAGNGAEWIAVQTTWADNSQFSISEMVIEDDSTNDTNAALGEITVDITFTPLSPGNLTIRVWTAAGSDLASSLDVAVTVTGQTITTTPPPEPLDLVGIWRLLMIIIPVVTGVILLILGIVAFRSNEQSR